MIALTPPKMNKSNILMLAPINWWEHTFPGNKGGINISAVQEFLIQTSYKLGIFKEKFIRGRGAWVDDERIIIHTGNKLIVNEKSVALREIRSRYV